MCVAGRDTQGTEAIVLGLYKQESCQHGAGAELQGVSLGSVALLLGTGALVQRVCQSFVTLLRT